jgi:small acid-soluble spore protein (thioredoxin-like protein)
MAKPDDRSDNIEKLQNAIENTMQNMSEASSLLKEHSGEMRVEDQEDIRAKNRRREDAIRGFRAEIQDEAHS